MPRKSLSSIRNLSLAVSAVLFCALTGCEEPEPIITYRIPTEVPPQLQPPKDRMLGAMMARGDQAWFVKVRGPEAAIAEVESDFRDFVTKLEFKNDKPNLDSAPATWKRSGEQPLRYASFNVDTESKQLDVSISALPIREDWSEFVVANVNRWRRQLGLEPSQAEWADGDEIEVASSGQPAVWVDLLEDPTAKKAPAMSPPFASQAGPLMAPPESPPPSREESESPLKFERPDGWRDGRMSSMRLAAFNVGPEDSPAEVTVIAAGGGLRENVDRWLGQVRGGEVPKEVVDQAMKDAERLKIAGRAAQRFILTGEDPKVGNAIDATIVALDGGASMFIKMTGPAATVTSQTDALTAFLQSLQF